MTLNEFCTLVKDELINIINDEKATVKLSTTIKNNGIELTSVTIFYPQDKISPNIYLNEFYFEDATLTDTVLCAKKVYEIYTKFKPMNVVDISYYDDYESIKPYFRLKLVNRTLNKEILKKAVHRPFLDMEVLVYARVDNEILGSGSITVLKDHLSVWGIDEDTLYRDAMDNQHNLNSSEIVGIYDLLMDMVKKMSLNDEDRNEAIEYLNNQNEKLKYIGMQVLSNKDRFYGASAMLDTEFLSKYSEEIDSDFFILPSSIHELIIVPYSEFTNREELTSMIKQVNDTTVAIEDKLSDSLYVYSQNENKVIMAE